MIKTYIVAFLCCLSCIAQAQKYSDIVQLHQENNVGVVQDIFVDNGKKYIVTSTTTHKKGEGLYFNDQKVITFEEDYDYTDGGRIKYIIQITENNEYIKHYTLYNPYGEVTGVKVVNDRIFAIYGLKYYKTKVVEYIDENTIDTLFGFEGQTVSIGEFDIYEDNLVISGYMINTPQVIYQNDTIHKPTEATGVSNTYVLSIDLKKDSINYGFSLGGPNYYFPIEDVKFDKDGIVYLIGWHYEPTVVFGDTLDWRGGAWSQDNNIIRLNPKGEVLSVNTFSSYSFTEDIQHLYFRDDGSYTVITSSDGYGDYYVDGTSIATRVVPFKNSQFIQRFDKNGKLKWVQPIFNNFPSYSSLIYESEETMYYGAYFKASEYNLLLGSHTIEYDNLEICVLYYEQDKETGEITKVSNFLCNGDDVRFDGGVEYGKKKSVVVKFHSEPILLNGEEIPIYEEGPYYNVLANVDFTTSVANTEFEANKVYPNPVRRGQPIKLAGNNLENNSQFELYATSGGSLTKGNVINNEINTEELNLTSGLYILKIMNGKNDTQTQLLFIH